MNRHISVFMAVLAMFAASCKAAEATNVKIQPSLIWVVADDRGKHEELVRYSSVVCVENAPCVLDFSRIESFENPSTRKRENFQDGVILRLKVRLSNGMAIFDGSSVYTAHLGVTSSYEEEDESLQGQTLRQYTSYFRGTSKLGHELRMKAAEDINNGVEIVLEFKPTKERPKSFKKEQILEP